MRRTCLLILIFSIIYRPVLAKTANFPETHCISSSQKNIKYFILDRDAKNSNNLIINKVELNAKKLYGLDATIDLYNVLLNDYTLVLFSVLPDLKNQSQTWNPIEIDEKNVISVAVLKQMIEHGKKTYLSSGLRDYSELKRNDIHLVIKKNGRYFLAENCITEFFTLANQELIFPNEMGIFYINIRSPLLSAKDFEERYKKIYNEYSVNAMASRNLTGSSSLKQPFEKPSLFLSRSFVINNQKAFQFWSFTDWRVADGGNDHRGIDRFIFLPGTGIIAGSFDYYFSQLPDSKSSLLNYLNEEVMMPVNINGKSM